jgi:hypothetical protein
MEEQMLEEEGDLAVEYELTQRAESEAVGQSERWARPDVEPFDPAATDISAWFCAFYVYCCA